MNKQLINFADRVISGEQLSQSDAELIVTTRGSDRYALLFAACMVRDHFFGNTVSLCSIVNAKSGKCLENCAFCAQSSYHTADIPIYPLISEESLVNNAREAEINLSTCYGIVTSGTGISNGAELDTICRALRRIRAETKILPSCSLGLIDMETAIALKEAGAGTYHHNLETARSFFPQICTTHEYDADIDTIRVAKAAGMKVCSGGIFGLGETAEQRIEMAMTLRELDVDSIPLNFLNPVQGTRLANAAFLTPQECLTTIALYRLLLPDKTITVCGGREKNLRDLQSWIFFAGANGTMIGNYLTTSGRNIDADHQMIRDLELDIVSCSKIETL